METALQISSPARLDSSINLVDASDQPTQGAHKHCGTYRDGAVDLTPAMAVHSEDQQTLLVASTNKRSLFGLCPRGRPRVAAEDEPEITHITLPLGYREEVHDRLLVSGDRTDICLPARQSTQ